LWFGDVVGVLVAVVGVLILFSQHPSSSSTIRLINKELQQRFGISFSQKAMTSSRQHVVVVVGGGLAGMSAALEAEKLGAKVLLFDKEKKLGGNSAKASSGINAVGTLPQQTAGIQDSIQTFIQDTLK
jgi:ribulose 1,5-bisphosphate synthetase/thiazole synthase